MRRRALLGAAVASPALSSCALACSRVVVADMPLRFVEGYPIVTASLAGRPVSFVLDTGAQGALVTPGVADSLGLPLAGQRRVFGTGGSQAARIVQLVGLRLGGAAMPAQYAPVLALPIDLMTQPPLAGLLGGLLLSLFELDFDGPGRQVRLWAADACPPPPGGVTVPIAVSRMGEAFIGMRVNGQAVEALVDTGSRATILSESLARRLGVSAPVSANRANGIDGSPMTVGHTTVRLALGDEAAREAPVSIAPLQLDRGEMLLGLDQLAGRRMLLRYGAGVAVFS